MGGQKNLILILTRELASNIAAPLFLVDHEGTLVFYNEPAEEILGLRFEEAGELPQGEWGTRWVPEDRDGRVLELEELPLHLAIADKQPAHREMRITTPDGTKRTIAVTAFPLFAHADDYVGAVAIFWPTEHV